MTTPNTPTEANGPVTERESEVYRELKQSERRARSVIEGTNVGTWEWNIQTGETIVNARWAQICGYRLEELEPVSIQTWLDLTHPEDLKEAELRLNAHFNQTESVYDFRGRMRHKDGHWIWVHTRGQVFEWTQDGAPLMMYGTQADVTQETHNLQRIQQQNTALGILNELALDPETDDTARIQKALRLGSEYLTLPLAIVSEITSEVYTIRWFHAPDDAGLEIGAHFPLSQTYCSILIEETQGQSLAIDHMGRSRHCSHDCYEAFGLESYIAAPIMVRDRLFGTLNFSSSEPRHTAFSDTEITFVTLLARWIAGVIERKISTELQTKLIEQVPGVLYQYRLWPDGHSAFPFASPHLEHIYGVEPADVLNDASAVFKSIHPDDQRDVENSISESAANVAIWQHQYRVKQGSHAWRWVEGQASPEVLPDQSIMWHGYIADIDDKKRIELALKESEAQLRRLYELSPIGIALNDYHSGDFLDANESLMAPTGYTGKELTSSTFRRLLPSSAATLIERIIAELRETGRYGPYELDILRKDGTTYPAQVRGMRITNASGRALVWSLVEDISERRKIDRMKSEFISTVSHELRTPLTSIAGSLGLVSSGTLGKLPDQVTRLISIAHRNSEQLKALVDDLLDMEKLMSGRMTMHLSDEQLLPIVQEASDRLRTYAIDSGVSVVIENADPDATATIDRARLDQAVTNLLSNAIKFSPNHGTVNVAIQTDGQQAHIRVSDEGPGVPNNFRPRIFQKFAQADSSDTRGKRGTGLGLAITKEIMTQMGGNVDFTSVEGNGATFWLSMPMTGPQGES
ncbi:hypothetical protein D777_02861 [Marinobacter nitratireducens]|uniref:histidine kinase n=1 Tax=Marinobacter nitratireducens TaxID=1137280 RepID=A0A072MZQ7_9GAMM|nr:PAS domain-containing protein [Marinobacter nitratireducens]KEF30919.1 hypothetical protein D777_02861 [Marinobacter nitratireducens]